MKGMTVVNRMSQVNEEIEAARETRRLLSNDKMTPSRGNAACRAIGMVYSGIRLERLLLRDATPVKPQKPGRKRLPAASKAA